MSSDFDIQAVDAVFDSVPKSCILTYADDAVVREHLIGKCHQVIRDFVAGKASVGLCAEVLSAVPLFGPDSTRFTQNLLDLIVSGHREIQQAVAQTFRICRIQGDIDKGFLSVYIERRNEIVREAHAEMVWMLAREAFLTVQEADYLNKDELYELAPSRFRGQPATQGKSFS